MALMVYITAPDPDTAERIAARLVERKLAACVNMIPNMRSVYRWQGQIERGEEVVLLAKTAEARYHALEETVLEAHPFECPCIVAWPLERGFPAFLSWITDATNED